jgi:hypothetical protein
VFLRFNRSVQIAFLLVIGVIPVFAQGGKPSISVGKPSDVKPKKEVVKPAPTPDPKAAATKPTTPEQVIETSLFIYGLGGGRPFLAQIRKTTIEHGKSSYTAADGKIEQANYQRFVIRGDALSKERIRLDQDFPTAKYSLVFSDEKIFGIYNNSVFTPREDASKSFENQIVHGLDAFLRYKENESTLELGDREKIMGVDYYVVTVTDKAGHKTRYFVSAKTYRVMMLTFEEGGVRYRRKFYDYNYAQGTLVPFRTVLWADDKIVEETDVGTVTYGQKVDEDLFKSS